MPVEPHFKFYPIDTCKYTSWCWELLDKKTQILNFILHNFVLIIV